jgi:MoxR-like ATPase
LDRFLFLIRLDYPSADEELEVMRRAAHGSGEQPEAVLDESHIAHIQQLVRALPVSDHVLTYARSLVRATRPHTEESHPAADKYLSFGAGPRASLGLMLAAKGHAVLNGQPYAGAHNVAAVALPVLRHRIAVNFAAQGEKVTSDDVVRTILEATPQA